MTRLVIDRHGKLWDPNGEAFYAYLDDPAPDIDLIAYAVRNLGSIDIDIRTGEAILRFRAHTVTPAALETAAKMLAQSNPPLAKITIHSETKEWEQHEFRSAADALAWMCAIPGSAPMHSVATQSRALRSIADRTLSKLDQPDDYFALLFKKWRLTNGIWPTDFAEFMFKFRLIDRSSVAQRRQDGTLVWQHMGSRITLYDTSEEGWQYRLQGRPLVDQPDHEYGRYAESCFRKALGEQTPAFDHVSAVIKTSRTSTRFSYDRLLLPWRTSNGYEIVSSLSYKTASDLVLSD